MSKLFGFMFASIILCITIGALGYYAIEAYKVQCNGNSLGNVSNNTTLSNIKDQEIAQLKNQLFEARKQIEQLQIQAATCGGSSSLDSSSSNTIVKEKIVYRCPPSGKKPREAKNIPAISDSRGDTSNVPELVTDNIDVAELNLPGAIQEDIIDRQNIESILEGPNYAPTQGYGGSNMIGGGTELYPNNNLALGGTSIGQNPLIYGPGLDTNININQGGVGGGGGGASVGAPIPGLVIPFLTFLGILGRKKKKYA